MSVEMLVVALYVPVITHHSIGLVDVRLVAEVYFLAYRTATDINAS